MRRAALLVLALAFVAGIAFVPPGWWM